jgi:hypothetical protein
MLPLIVREAALVVEAIERAQSFFPWRIRGLDFDNVPWCHPRDIEVTRSRAYKKNDQAFVEQKNGAVVRRPIRSRSPAHQLLPAVVQAEEEAPGGRQGDQPSPCPGNTMRASFGASGPR